MLSLDADQGEEKIMMEIKATKGSDEYLVITMNVAPPQSIIDGGHLYLYLYLENEDGTGGSDFCLRLILSKLPILLMAQ